MNRRRFLFVLALEVALTVAAVPAIVASIGMIETMQAEVRASQLRLATLSALQADRMLLTAFGELERVAIDSYRDDGSETLQSVAPRTSLTQALIWVEAATGMRSAEVKAPGLAKAPDSVLLQSSQADDWFVSEPWADALSGRPVTALSVPIYSADGVRAAALVGIMDLTEPLVTDLIQPMSEYGWSGHADLVDERGLVLASTEPGHVLGAGDHPDFYDRAASLRVPMVERVQYESDVEQEAHIMAYAPLRVAQWGVALGAAESDAYGAIWNVRRHLAALGFASLAALIVGIAVAFRFMRNVVDAPTLGPATLDPL